MIDLNNDPGAQQASDADAAKLEQASKYLYELFADDQYHFSLFLFVLGENETDAVQAGVATSLSYDLTRMMVAQVLADEPTSEETLTCKESKPTLN
jgi:hypothetical protein